MTLLGILSNEIDTGDVQRSATSRAVRPIRTSTSNGYIGASAFVFREFSARRPFNCTRSPASLNSFLNTLKFAMAVTVSKRFRGYPQVHEDDVERAVRAGLKLIAAEVI